MQGPNERRRAPRRVIKTMAPDQPGAVKWSRRYGPALVCVRYRHDAEGRMRYTTIELVVDEMPVRPRPAADPIVGVAIPIGATELRRRAAALGARWNAGERLWWMRLSTAKQLGLQRQVRARRNMPAPAHPD